MLYHGDCAEYLKDCKPVDIIFMDPPDNIDYKYEGFKDQRPDYITWLMALITLSMKKAKVVWISYNAIHDLNIKGELAWVLKSFELYRARTFIWTYKFGQNRRTDCGSGYRPLLRLARLGTVWNAWEIRVESVRQRMGDKRANPAGSVPLDVWDFDSVIDIPIITGKHRERRTWHPTQLPEAVVRRALAMSPGTTVLDLFAGTGTVLRVCEQLGRECVACEISDYYIKQLEAEGWTQKK